MSTKLKKKVENNQLCRQVFTSLLRGGSMSLVFVLLIGIWGCQGEDEEKVVTPPAYSPLQQLFSLNILSNISAHYNNHAGDTILDSTIYAIDTVLNNPGVQQLIGRWKCVWGPGVMTSSLAMNDSVVAANTMYVAQNLDTPGVYVVAIAGTDPNSAGDWIFEDGDVLSFRFWDDVLLSLDTHSHHSRWDILPKPFISKATNDGLVRIMQLKDTTKSKSVQTAAAFLQNLIDTAKTPMTIWTTGHSLGGALSPTLALYLNDKWASGKSNITIGCLAVAGATPGNWLWAERFRKELGSSFIRVWNQLDVVPHGFATISAGPPYLMQVDTIYTRLGSINTPDTMGIDGTALLLVPYIYTQLQTDNKGFASKFYGVPPTATNTVKFFTELAAQHIPAYAVYFGISGFQNNVQTVLKLNSPFFSEGFSPQAITDSGSYPTLRSLVLGKTGNNTNRTAGN